jgi:hypothetical protein
MSYISPIRGLNIADMGGSMPKLAVGMYRRGLSLLAAAAFFIFGADLARAQGFNEQVAGKTAIYLKDIAGVGSVLNSLKLQRLANIQMTGVTATSDTISGYVNFLNMRWNFLVFKAKTETFFALEPVTASGAPRAPKLSDFIGPRSGPLRNAMAVVDMLTLDRLVWVIAARNIELDDASLPAGAVKTMFAPYFGNSTLSVEFGQGITFLGASDIGKIGVLKQGFEALTGKPQSGPMNALVKAGFQTAVLDAMLSGSTPSVEAHFQAALPPIVKPNLFGKLEIPVTFAVSLVASVEPLEGTAKLGYVAEAAGVPFVYPDIAKKREATARTTMDIEVGFGIEGGKPVFSVASTMFKGQAGAFKQAFGLPFLDLQDYTMAFEVKADALAVGIGAGGRFYDKNITTFAAVQVPAQTAGIPIPDQIKFMVEPTNANAVASLSLRDLTNAFADLTNAVTGSRIPKPNLPENFMQIAGTGRGLGPFVDVNLNMGLDAGLEMGGKMVVFGTELGVIETAVLKPTHGIEIKGHTDVNLPIDILRLPKGEVDIAVTLDNITDPHVRIKVESMSVLGSQGNFEFSIDKARQVAIVEGASPFKLFEASLVLESNTANLRNPNFDMTGIIEGAWFSKFADGVQTATADIAKGVESAVSGMNEEIHVFTGRLSQAKIDKTKAVNDLEVARASAQAEFNKAKAEVDKLKSKYDSEKRKCGSPPWKWHHCVAAGALWTSLQTARGVLSVAAKVVDEFLKGTGAVLSAVINGLNQSIQVFAKTIEVASTALGTALSTFGNAIALAGHFVGEALSVLAEIFDIEKLWMKGKLAVLSNSQKGALGVEYTLLGKSYLKDVAWDFNVPVEKIFEVFVPGSDNSRNEAQGPLPGNAPAPVQVAGGGADFAKFAYNPVTTPAARGVSEALIEAGQLKALSVPFNPEICEAHPYALEEQIAMVEEELTQVSWRRRNAEIGQWVRAMEGSGDFMAVTTNPRAVFSWTPSGQGRALPKDAVSGGQEPGRPNLYICRGTVERGTVWASGKVVAGKCNVGWKGKEHELTSYDVLTGDARAVMWIPSPTAWKGSNGMYVGKEGNGDVHVCRANYQNGWHPGKIAPNGYCYIGWGGQEHRFTGQIPRMFQVLIPNPAYAYDFTSLVKNYQAAKTSFAERNTADKFRRQASLLSGLESELRKAPSGHSVRQSVEANFKKKETLQQQVDPVWLAQQEKDIKALQAELIRLRNDPVSPCGQVAKEQGVRPIPAQPAQQPVARIGTSPAAIGKAINQAVQQAQQNVAQAMMQESKMAHAVATAAQKAAADQKAAQRAQREKLKKEQLLAFAQRVTEHQKAAQQRAEHAMKVQSAREVIKAPEGTPQQRGRVVAAAKLGVEKVEAAKVVVQPGKPVPQRVAQPGPATAQMRSAAVGQPAATAVKSLSTRTTLSPTQRTAFARSFEESQKRAQLDAQAVAAQRKQEFSRVAARRNAAMMARLGNVEGMTEQQKKVLAESFAKAEVRGRAEMVKHFPVERKSSLAGHPAATGEAAKEPVTPAQDMTLIQGDYRRNLRHLGINVR